MTRPLSCLAFVLAAAALTSCSSPYAKVRERRPQWIAALSPSTLVASAEQRITTGMVKDKADAKAAMGEYLSAAKLASEQLAKAPSDSAARDAYNFAVARVLGTIKKSKLYPWEQPLVVPSAEGPFTLTHRRDPRPQWNPALYDFTPADEFDIGGRYVADRKTKAGVGAPLVAVGRGMNEDAERDFGAPRVYYGVTALIRFEGRRAIITIEDPLKTENVTLAGRSQPMAADYTVPLAVLLDGMKPEKLELSRLVRPGKFAQTARISRLQPYDPDKTVVFVIHGLMDSPATWTPMINELRADETIRRNYQFWFYSYPSGYPYPYSAMILRQQLDEVMKRFPLKHKMVVIGHSMGGCITRVLLTDSGDKIWMDIFGRRPEDVDVSPDTKKIIMDSVVFKPRTEIGRAIFISAPLQGSDLATNWVGRLGSRLVRSPFQLVKAGREVLKFITFRSDDLKLKRIPNSVDTLSPKNRFVKSINTIPIEPVPHHVICGDRGKGGNKDKTKPMMSDGVVPYWSSHMETAKSELIVPSSHSAHQNPQAIAEVRRILKLHAGGR